jgi:hypothetical protein
MTTVPQLLTQADDALAAADWSGARRLYSEALAHEETAEALEGLAAAAFFLDDVEVVFDARQRAFTRYREQLRPVDAARVAIALAWDFRTVRTSERSATAGWRGRAGCSTALRPRGSTAGSRSARRRSPFLPTPRSHASGAQRPRRSDATSATSTCR